MQLTHRLRGRAGARRRGRVAALALVASAAGGCANRELVSGPTTPPSTATWAVVWFAGALLALVVGVLLTLPAWERPGGARLAVAVLTVQTGAVVVAGTLLTAVAYRSSQLLERAADARPVVSLLRLSRVDGDSRLMLLVVVLALLTTALLATLTSLAARFAAGDDATERWVATALLAIELGASGFALVQVLLGEHGWPWVAGALALPVLAAALAGCWPRRDPARTPVLRSGYNPVHG